MAVCDLEQYLPHREQQPSRHCANCETLLSTGNLTDTCWQCEPTWSHLTTSYWEQAEAFAQLMEEPA